MVGAVVLLLMAILVARSRRRRWQRKATDQSSISLSFASEAASLPRGLWFNRQVQITLESAQPSSTQAASTQPTRAASLPSMGVHELTNVTTEELIGCGGYASVWRGTCERHYTTLSVHTCACILPTPFPAVVHSPAHTFTDPTHHYVFITLASA